MLAVVSICCKPPEETQVRAIIGAVLIDGAGSPPISRSVLVVAGSRVRSIGMQASTPIPPGSEKVNGAGRFLIPAPVAIPDTLPRVRTLEEARSQVDGGAVALAGMALDTEQFDPSLLKKWRDLRVVFVPRLHELAGEELRRAQRNARALAAGGVRIAAGAGPQAAREWRLLAESGLTPPQLLAAATVNAARAARRDADLGSLEPGMTASFWLLTANPLEDASNLDESKAERVMSAGEWTR
jgi:imidazolonepropionase-like amidohydrolase